VWILTLITNKYAYMDKLWPILPGFYTWLFFLSVFVLNPTRNESIKLSTFLENVSTSATIRLAIIVALITAWSIRMTFIFWRRGYYKWDFEDKRWDLMKVRLNYPQKKLPFQIYNFVFMALLQNYILFGYALPVWFIETNKETQSDFNFLDGICIGIYVVFYSIEAIADEQQWRFQSRKYKWLNKEEPIECTPQEEEDFKRGFLVKGLFKYSRHPNYFGDIFLWWSVYLFTISSQYSSYKESFNFFSLFNYSLLAALIMSLLFFGSSNVTEKISESKYPEYAHYKKKVNRIFPSWRGYEPSNQ
jgi:steroid 5-alpha reductase family enzyme